MTVQGPSGQAGHHCTSHLGVIVKGQLKERGIYLGLQSEGIQFIVVRETWQWVVYDMVAYDLP